MCQLLGMNCAAPTDFSFSLRGFCRRGGATDKHSHGWGTAIYEGRGVRCFHDTLPACQSPIAELIQSYRIRTYNMMSHIRYATQGEVSLENVHPFNRELWGIAWTFAHNGDVPLFTNVSADHVPLLGRTTTQDLHFCPVGDTDSEAVFCAILNALKAEFPDGLPTLPVLHEFLSYICEEIILEHSEDTIFNFLLGCGQYTMFAYSWPGARPGSKNSQVTTKPLTDEPGWRELKRGELLMFNRGNFYRTPKCCEVVELSGEGLVSRCVKTKCDRSPARPALVPRSTPTAFELNPVCSRSGHNNQPATSKNNNHAAATTTLSLRDSLSSSSSSPSKAKSVLTASAVITEAANAAVSPATSKSMETRMASLVM